jgi:hypothetical protein
LLLVLLVGALTVASASHPGLASSLAASPSRVARSRVWLRLTSGLLAERPIGPSIISFALLAGCRRPPVRFSNVERARVAT